MITTYHRTDPDRVKVLHIITHLGVGGALDNTLLTVERLPRERYQVDLAAGTLPADEHYTSWEERSRHCADSLFLFPELQRQVRPLQDFRACQKLAAFMREQSYDIVHTHCAKAGVVGRLAAKMAKVPIIVHTCHAFGSQVARSQTGNVWRESLSTSKKHAFTLLERFAGRLSDQVITVCDENRQQAINQKLAPAQKIVTIYSGIDLKQFEVSVDVSAVCQQLELDPARPRIGFIGRLAEQKAPWDFIKAAKLVLAERPDAQFIIAGDGPLTNQVLQDIRDEPRIRCIGFRRDVPELLASLSVLGLSSLWEGLGRSVTEAMIMGIPVAATAVDGVPELVIHGETGLLSPARQPELLAKNILWLINHPDQASQMAHVARQRVVPAFGAERMLDRIDSLYQQLLKERNQLPQETRFNTNHVVTKVEPQLANSDHD